MGWMGGPRFPDAEKQVIHEFETRENLAEMLQACFDIAYAEPFDKKYLEQKIRVWNAMEEQQRGFDASGGKVTKFDFKAGHGRLQVFFYPASESVQLQYTHIRD